MAGARARIPDATVARLPLYRRGLLDLVTRRVGTVSSEQLAELAGVNAAKVRKDLSYLGSYGTRGVGYDVQFLLFEDQINPNFDFFEFRNALIILTHNVIHS